MSAEYENFLDRKTHVGSESGFEPLWMPDILFPFQRSLVEWAQRKGRAAIFADCGLGKGLPAHAPVLTPFGWRPIGSLCVGDEVMGADGSPHAVTGVFPRGEQDVYRVTFSDGVSIVCDDDHLWSVRGPNDLSRRRPWRVMSTKELRATNLHYGKAQLSRRWRIPLTKPVEFAPRDLPVHPYIVGVMLGDGSMHGLTPLWTKNDPEIANRIRGILPPGVSVVGHHNDRASNWSFVNEPRNPHVPNPIRAAFESMGLWGLRASEKFVPESYLFSSVADRLALFQGLMDTDGYASDFTPEFSSCAKPLAEAVVWLAESFGGTAHLALKESPAYTYKGESKIGLPSWRVTMSLPPDIAPFSLPRKAARYHAATRGLGRWIQSIEPVGREATVCIKVDAPDELFLTEHCVVTHNTFLQLTWAENVARKTGKPVLILTPLAVAFQTVREGQKLGLDVQHRRDGRKNGDSLVVTNYERLHYFNSTDYAGVVCDESSALKNCDGATRAAVTDFMRKTPYRLLCTATAAPNDYIELGTSSEALGEMGFSDMLSRFFKKVEKTLSRKDEHRGGVYRFRGHAERDFWRWVVSWARAMRKPSDLGFDDAGFSLPPLSVQEHHVRANRPREGLLFDLPAMNLFEQREELRRTIVERCEMAASLINAHDRQSIAWCHLNDEGHLLEKSINGAVEVEGSDSEEFKEEAFRDFAAGKIRVLVSKPAIAAFGLNLQNCAHMTFFPSHSYEQYYQAVRRCWRFGQKSPVTVDVISTQGQSEVLANLKRKTDAAERMFEYLVSLMRDELKIVRKDDYTKSEEVPSWL